MKVRIKDIAKRAGVSAGTVDRVLHNRGEVSDDTRKKIMDIVKELDYKPDIVARSLASKKNYLIAVLLPEVGPQSPYWALPLNGVDKAIQEIAPFNVTVKKIFFNLVDHNSFGQKAQEVLQLAPNAVLLTPAFRTETLHFVDQCAKCNIPYVFIDSNIDQCNPLAYIGHNNVQSGKVAGKLLSFAIKNEGDILIVSITNDRANANHIIERIDGFKSYLSEFQPNINIREIVTNDSDEAIVNQALLKAVNDNVKGIFVPNSRSYRVADFLIKYQRAGIKLVGYDLLEKNCDHLRNGVIDFLITQRPDEQGYKAINALFLHIMMEKRPGDLQYLPIDIIMKENIDFYNAQ